ncbi:MAG TPA: aminopeptidase [Gemmatimonadales bacterium]|nr:aminopeptidase [Gemmatimonadales bacterium]
MPHRRGVPRVVLFVVGMFFAAFGAAYVASEEVRYLSRAVVEEIKILEGRRPIAELVADSATPAELRRSLALVLAARDYAARLGLEAKDTYTSYSDVGRDTLLLVLSAAPKNCVCPYTWKYPIVGRIPYKGFFDPGMARRAAAKLERRGYDVYLRPAGAFSTLGWLEDPLLSTALDRDPVELVSTVFHEIAHNTLFVKHAVPFNESFAQMVGYRAAEAFFRDRGDTAAARRAAWRWEDEIVLADYYTRLAQRLRGAYARAPEPPGLDSARAEVGRWARAELAGPVAARLRTIRIGPLAERPVNNARVVAATIYRERLELFERWYRAHGADVRRSVAALERLVDGVPGDSVYPALERALAALARDPAAGSPAPAIDTTSAP